MIIITIGISAVSSLFKYTEKYPPLNEELLDAAIYGDYDFIARYATHNSKANQVMLGKYGDGGPTSYIARAGKEYAYYSLDEYYVIEDIVGRNGMLEINRKFLNQQVSMGKAFYSSHPVVNATGDFKMELDHLYDMFKIKVEYKIF